MAIDSRTRALYREIGRLIAASRTNNSPSGGKLTQLDLASRTGGRLSRSTMANIESGRQRLAVHQLYELADVLGVHPKALLPNPSRFRAGASARQSLTGEDTAARELLDKLGPPRRFGPSIPTDEARTP